MPIQCLDTAGLEAGLYRLYREFFDRAEKKRRWSLRGDIPWGRCSRSLDPAVADVVESFCAVEMYLPDYVAHAMRVFRPSRACTWSNSSVAMIVGTGTPIHSSAGRIRTDVPPAPLVCPPMSGCRRLAGTSCIRFP